MATTPTLPEIPVALLQNASDPKAPVTRIWVQPSQVAFVQEEAAYVNGAWVPDATKSAVSVGGEIMMVAGSPDSVVAKLGWTAGA